MYMAIGVSKEEVDEGCPTDLKPYLEAQKIRRKMKDEEMWYMQQYISEALMVGLAHFGAGLGGKSSSAKTHDKPFMFEIEEQEGKETDNNEFNAVYEMKQRTKMLEREGLPASPR